MKTETDDLSLLIAAATPALDDSLADEGAEFLVDHGQWWTEQRRRLRHLRRLVFGGAIVYGGVYIWVLVMVQEALRSSDAAGGVDRLRLIWLELAAVAAVPLVLVGFALWLAHRRGFVSQVFSRALLWSLTVIVGLMQWMLSRLWRAGADPEFPIGDTVALVGTLVCVGALLVLGNHGLRSPRQTGFRRTPLHGVLTLSLVMGLADTILLAVAQLAIGKLSTFDPVVVILCIWLGVSAFGLYRLRTWGLIAMIVGNLAELVLAAQGMLNGVGDMVVALILTAVVQLLLPLPIIRAMLRRGEEVRALPKVVERLPTIVLLAVAALSVVEWVTALLRW